MKLVFEVKKSTYIRHEVEFDPEKSSPERSILSKLFELVETNNPEHTSELEDYLDNAQAGATSSEVDSTDEYVYAELHDNSGELIHQLFET